MTRVLKDNHGIKIGEIRVSGSKQIIFDSSGRKMGEYDEDTDMTKDRNGRKVGSGNLLSSLLNG